MTDIPPGWSAEQWKAAVGAGSSALAVEAGFTPDGSAAGLGFTDESAAVLRAASVVPAAADGEVLLRFTREEADFTAALIEISELPDDAELESALGCANTKLRAALGDRGFASSGLLDASKANPPEGTE